MKLFTAVNLGFFVSLQNSSNNESIQKISRVVVMFLLISPVLTNVEEIKRRNQCKCRHLTLEQEPAGRSSPSLIAVLMFNEEFILASSS
jgi:hypothetical protein